MCLVYLALITLLTIVTAIPGDKLVPTLCHRGSREQAMRKGCIHQFQRGSIRDYVLRERLYRNETTGSFLTCAGYCLRDDACKSFIFCKDDKQCELNSAVYSKDLRDLRQFSGCLYFDEECCKAVNITTQPSNPVSFKFILSELTTPFRLRFTVRAEQDAVIALAKSRQKEDIFCHITIGGWSNTKAAIRSGDLEIRPTEYAVFEKKNQLSALEDRAFWIEYANGQLRVGKRTGGAVCAPFMQWNVSTVYDPAPSKVYTAISSWHSVSGEWVFDQFCE